MSFSKTKFTLYIASMAFLTLQANPIPYSVEDKEEAFLVRRIAEFWKDQDYFIVKAQIVDFLEKYPKSRVSDHLRGILGDLYLQEHAYEKALSVYNQIKSLPIIEKTILNKLQCLYELSSFEQMLQEGSCFLTKLPSELELRKEEFHFLMAESYFRSATRIEEREKKLEYFNKAAPLYEGLLNSPFNDPVMFALAEIYHFKKENQKAASFFFQLAEKHPDKKEDLLFHAALAQSEFDRKAAIETFASIMKKEGAKAKDAALNRLILLFQEDLFQDVIDAYSTVDAEKEPAVMYMIGRSYFENKAYKDSSLWLQKYLSIAEASSLEFRNVLLMQLNSAQILKDKELYHETLSLLERLFPKDAELPQAIFIHALMLKDLGDFAQAEEAFAKLLQNYPHFNDLESLLLEYGLTTHTNKAWEKAYSTLSLFLKQYPASSYSSSAWKYLLSSGLHLLKQKEAGMPVSYTKDLFYEDLKKALSQKELLTSNEQEEFLLLQGKLGYELNKYKESLASLSAYIQAYPENSNLPEAHLLAALCYQKLQTDPKLFCKHAEIALHASVETINPTALHLELYNAYISLKDAPAAANHLYQAFQLEETAIPLENRLWLANYYYDMAATLPQFFETDGPLPTPETQLAFDRAKALFENILVQSPSSGREWELLKLANLAGREGLFDKKIALLCKLIEQNGALQKEALIELAKTYELALDRANAYDTFAFTASHFHSEYAALHATRLKFKTLSPSQKTEENPEVVQILNDLKELQIRKSPASEPIHLESALEYARVRSELAKPEEKDSSYLFFLNRIKENFNDTEDPTTLQYQKALKENPEKARLYALYMQFLENELLHCKDPSNQTFASSYYLKLRTLE